MEGGDGGRGWWRGWCDVVVVSLRVQVQKYYGGSDDDDDGRWR